MMLQTSCSELLVDTRIHDPEEALARLTALFAKHGWDSSPPLTLEVLREVKARTQEEREARDTFNQGVFIYDSHGNGAWLEYASGYLPTGYHLCTHHCHHNASFFPLMKVIVDELAGKLVACDGGSTKPYEEWEKEQHTYEQWERGEAGCD
jgi:hypothetical protein